MPGIFGVFGVSNRNNLPKLMDDIISSMSTSVEGDRVDSHINTSQGFCIGRKSLGILNTTTQPLQDETGRFQIVFHGELYNNEGPTSDPSYVLARFSQYGDACVAKSEGSFHFAIYDSKSRVVKLFSDKFGLLPLYYSILPNGIIFAGETKAILQEKTVGRDLDYQSLADFMHFGQALGQKTLFRSIKLLPPGSVLTFDITSNKYTIQGYWNLNSIFVPGGDYSSHLTTDDAASLLIKSISNRLSHKEDIGLSLSGGLDSRAIMAGMKDEARGLSTYTLGLQGCADQKLAARLSAIAGTRHEFVELDRAYLRDFEKVSSTMIHLSDGMYHPRESTEILALEYFKRAGFKILLRGHGGELAKAALAYPVKVTRDVRSLSIGRGVIDKLFESANIVMMDFDPKLLFHNGAYKFTKEAAKQSIIESCDSVSELLTPADVFIYYYLKEYIRRHDVASLEIFRTQVEIRLPFLDEEYLKLLMQLPVQNRNFNEVHLALIRQCMPELVKVPDSNTGAPMDANLIRLTVTDKINTLMKRLKIRGFRHYAEFQDWHRKSFREIIKRIIFSKELMDRGIFDPNGLKAVFEQHISGKKDYANLLGTIVGIELWFRDFVD